MCSLTHAFQQTRLLRTVRSASSSLSGNILDGIPIPGDLTPLQNNLLVRVKPAAASTSGGLFIPDNAQEKPNEGEVVAAGPGRIHSESGLLQPAAVKVGLRVIYGQFDGTSLKYNDKDHQMIKDDDVLLQYTGEEIALENVEAVKDHILIRLPPKEDKTLTGIIINTAETKEKKQCYGTVEKVGPGRPAGNGDIIPIQVAPGDGCRFRDFAGTNVKIGMVDFVVVRAYDVMAKW